MKKLQNKIQILLKLYKSQKLIQAELMNRELIKEHPKLVILYNILGLILSDQNKKDKAIETFEQGISIDPNFAMIYSNLGNLYKSKKNYLEAEEYYKQSIKLDSKISEPHNNLANLYDVLNKFDLSIKSFKEAINLNPNQFISYYNLGRIYKNTGDFENAKFNLEKSIELNNFFFPGHRLLSQLIKYTKNDTHYLKMKNIFENKRFNPSQKVELAFALGKASDDMENYKDAYEYYKFANDQRRLQINFSINKEIEEFKNIKKFFNKEISKKNDNKSLKQTPIFILGMPRSGTTLVEQILSSHKNVFAGDELNFLQDISIKYLFNEKKILSLKKMKDLNQHIIEKIHDEYLLKLKSLSPDSKMITDKHPINFKWIGLIKIAFPQAKIIHCVRSPKDNCLSIYKNYFSNTKLNFAYNLNELSSYFKLYHDLLKHWNILFPNFVMNVSYEKIVEDPKKQIERILEFSNLTWDNNCMEFYNNKRPIRTASDTQVRQKIYNKSVNSWRNYDTYLADFFGDLPT